MIAGALILEKKNPTFSIIIVVPDASLTLANGAAANVANVSIARIWTVSVAVRNGYRFTIADHFDEKRQYLVNLP